MSEGIAIDESLLPPLLRQIVRAIGAPLALSLVRSRGGTRLHLADGPLLRDLIGPDATRALLTAFAGRQEITLPKADKIIAQLRNHAIRAEAGGKSLMQQALEHDLTTRQVQNIRAGLAAGGGHESGLMNDLFDPSRRSI